MNVLSTASTYLCLHNARKMLSSETVNYRPIGLYTYTLAQSTSNVFDRLFINDDCLTCMPAPGCLCNTAG